MNSLSFHEPTIPIHLADMRENQRIDVSDLLVVLKWGTGQVLEISHTGLSFGCLYPHILPEQWSMDILDAQGIHLKNLQVRKVWEKTIDHPEPLTRFEIVTGVEFINPTPEQKIDIQSLVERLEYADISRMFEELELSGFRHPATP